MPSSAFEPLAMFAYAFGEPSCTAQLKQCPEDFLVTELNSFTLSGEGEHLWLFIEKRLVSTLDVTTALARHFQVSTKDIGFAGMKDVVAVTQQWFSVQLPGKSNVTLPVGDHSFKILSSQWHSQKLKTGGLTGNQFVIVLRDIRGDRAELFSRLEKIKQLGFPNYFGPQRFGKNLKNLHQGESWLRKNKKTRKLTRPQSMQLSALRSYVFNCVLHQRLTADTWHQAIPGEPMMLAGSNSYFMAEAAEMPSLTERLAARDIVTTGPLVGDNTIATGEFLDWEKSVVSDFSWIHKSIADMKMRERRRPLFVYPESILWDWVAQNALSVAFTLKL